MLLCLLTELYYFFAEFTLLPVVGNRGRWSVVVEQNCVAAGGWLKGEHRKTFLLTIKIGMIKRYYVKNN